MRNARLEEAQGGIKIAKRNIRKGCLSGDVFTFDVIRFFCLREEVRDIANVREAVCDANYSE